MVPHIIHQIWIGPLPPPFEWMESWRALHPGWEYRLWREAEIEAFGLRNRQTFDRYYETMRQMIGAADVARMEILLRYGGVYVDADSECVRSLDGAPFMDAGFFAAYEGFVADRPGHIGNAVIGARPGHPVIEHCVQAIGAAKRLEPAWRRVGGGVLTEAVKRKAGQDTVILPPCTFYPEHHTGQIAPDEGLVYARQFWGTTRKLYGLTPTPEQSEARTRDGRSMPLMLVAGLTRPVRRRFRKAVAWLRGRQRRRAPQR